MFWQKIYWGSDFCPKQEMSVVAFKTDARQRCRLPILENSPIMLMIHSRFYCFQLYKIISSNSLFHISYQITNIVPEKVSLCIEISFKLTLWEQTSVGVFE